MTVFALVACSESSTSSPVASTTVPVTATATANPVQAGQVEPTPEVLSDSPVATLMSVPEMVNYAEVENWSSANAPGIV